MLSNEFAAMLAPFRLVSTKSALSITYRSLELDCETIRGAAKHGMLEVRGQFGLPDGGAIYVDAASFIAVISSLPSQTEIEFSVEDGGVLEWMCGAAKGRLALLKISEMPRIKRAASKAGAWAPTPEFIQVLRLGMLSCGNESLATIGAYGVVLDNSSDLCIYSTDDITIAAAFMTESPKIAGPDILTFSPEALVLLAAVIDPQDPASALEMDDQSIYYQDAARRCLIKQIAPLKVNINGIFEQFTDNDIMVELPAERIGAFIKRINAISESKRGSSLKIGASKGKLNMSFSDGLASSEEYYLVDELEVPDLPPIELDAVKLGRALAHTTHIVLDYIDRHVLILQGGDPIFQYIISAKG